MFKKFKDIGQAWITAANPSQEEKEKAEDRLSKCNDCEFKRQNTTLIDFYYCELCNCPLDKKIFAQDKESCPEKKWTI
jgi:hypothetical protein